MALDIYAGGFARYYAREWENVMQRHARENNLPYQVNYPDGDPGPAKWEEIQEIVGEWKGALGQVLGQALGEQAPSDLDWDETRAAPYFTDRPGWDGYSALVLLAACSACGEPLPDQLAEDALASEVIERTFNPEMRNANRSITKAQLWLPGSFMFSFNFVDLCEQETHLCSVDYLVEDLNKLVSQQNLTAAALEQARQDGVPENATALQIARFGLAVFHPVALQAQKHRLPILLSF